MKPALSQVTRTQGSAGRTHGRLSGAVRDGCSVARSSTHAQTDSDRRNKMVNVVFMEGQAQRGRGRFSTAWPGVSVKGFPSPAVCPGANQHT